MVRDLTALNSSTGGGAPNGLVPWERDKQRERGGTAEAAGARFVPFVMSSQGHIAPEGNRLLERMLGERAVLGWWQRRLALAAVRGTQAMAEVYFATQSTRVAVDSGIPNVEESVMF